MVGAAAMGGVCGALLGTRFRVFALVPLHLLAIAAAATGAATGHLSAGRALLDLVAFSLCSHFGYLAAALVCDLRRGRERSPLGHPF